MPFALPEFDLDEVFAYRTQKVVVIKDRYLGGLRYAGIVGVLLYFFIDRIIIDQAYYVREPIFGIIETSLKGPTNKTTAAELPYCSGGPGGASRILPCYTGPDAWVQTPSSGGAELFVATRLKDRDGHNATRTQLSFILEPERYTVGISFSVTAPKLYDKSDKDEFVRTMADLQTSLVDNDGNPLHRAVKRISRFDTIELKDLLQAAGLDGLDSSRYSGVVLHIMIECPMGYGGSVNNCFYSVKRVTSAAKMYIAAGVNARDGDHRVQERRGVKIVVTASGEMGRFKWSALMLAWVSALGMLGIIVFVVDLLMVKIMPLRKIYGLMKYEETVDFSDYRAGETHAISQVKNLVAESDRKSGRSDMPLKESEPMIDEVTKSTESLQPEVQDVHETCGHSDDLESGIGREASDEEILCQQTRIGRPASETILPAPEDIPESNAQCMQIDVAEQRDEVLNSSKADDEGDIPWQEQLAERFSTEISSKRIEIEDRLKEHLEVCLSSEREHWSLWMQNVESELACQQQNLQEYVNNIVSARSAEESVSTSERCAELKQLVMEEQTKVAGHTQEKLRELLLDDLRSSMAHEKVALQQVLSEHLASNIRSDIATIQQQFNGEVTSLRELQKELRTEISQLHETWHKSSQPISKEALTEPEHLASNIRSDIANIQQQFIGEVTSLREGQKELRTEISQLRETWHRSSQPISKEALTEQLVRWQPEFATSCQESQYNGLADGPSIQHRSGIPALCDGSRLNLVLDEARIHPTEVVDSTSNVGIASTSDVQVAAPLALPSLRKVPFDRSPAHQQIADKLQSEIASLKMELSRRSLDSNSPQSNVAIVSKTCRSATHSPTSSAEVEDIGQFSASADQSAHDVW